MLTSRAAHICGYLHVVYLLLIPIFLSLGDCWTQVRLPNMGSGHRMHKSGKSKKAVLWCPWGVEISNVTSVFEKHKKAIKRLKYKNEKILSLQTDHPCGITLLTFCPSSLTHVRIVVTFWSPSTDADRHAPSAVLHTTVAKMAEKKMYAHFFTKRRCHCISTTNQKICWIPAQWNL